MNDHSHDPGATGPIHKHPVLLLMIPEGSGQAHAANGATHAAARLRVRLPLPPRVAALLTDIKVQKRRIGRDCRQHLLTEASGVRLQFERSRIRHRLIKILRRNRGRIPLKRLDELESQMTRLKSDIRQALPR